MDALPAGAIDLGHDTYYVKIMLAREDRSEESEAEWVGIDEFHLRPETGKWCGGWIPFKRDVEQFGDTWTVESFEPLTLSPSLLCRTCNHHGFIREGRWVPA